MSSCWRVPRPPESRELESTREYVETQLVEAGWSVRRHPFEAKAESGEKLRGVNLVATRGEAGRPRFCLGAHLDSRPQTPGADDNASGVAALLEVARLVPKMVRGEPMTDVELVVFDLEEAGMLGGAEHARLMKSSRTDFAEWSRWK